MLIFSRNSPKINLFLSTLFFSFFFLTSRTSFHFFTLRMYFGFNFFFYFASKVGSFVWPSSRTLLSRSTFTHENSRTSTTESAKSVALRAAVQKSEWMFLPHCIFISYRISDKMNASISSPYSVLLSCNRCSKTKAQRWMQKGLGTGDWWQR